MCEIYVLEIHVTLLTWFVEINYKLVCKCLYKKHKEINIAIIFAST